ncbi:MAG: ABC transporter ATP-binding protein [Eubacterium sp.]|nr:ABC transporter ATP-binding protein [Eubacterium sp.]
MKLVARYIKHYKVQAVMAPLFKMLEAIFELLVPLVVAKMIDDGIGTGNKGTIYAMGGILIGLAMVGFGCSVTAQYFSAVAAAGVGKELRYDLFRHINRLSYRELDQLGTSTLVTRMTSDTNQVQTGVNMVLRLFLRSPFIVFGAVIMAFTVDVRIATIFLIVLPVLMAVVFSITFASIPLYRRVQDRLDRVTLLTRENLIGARVIRAFNHEEQEKREYDETSNRLKKSQLFVGRITAFMNPVTYVIVNLGIAALIHFGAIRVDAGDLTQGQVVALVNYMSQILVELIKLANLIITMTKSIAASRRVAEVLAVENSVIFREQEAERGHGARVAFRDVSVRYQGSREAAVEHVTFTAMPGETIGVIGGTGSGKSTLVNLIPRFYEATEGTVEIDGVDIRNYPKRQLRDGIGVVPQKAVLFSGTIADNLRWGRADATEEELWQALRTAQAEDFVKEKNDGLSYMLTQGGKNLSGGQRQRLTIARALVRRPGILILDDSASALDFATDAALRRALKKDTEGMTTFLVSQRVSTVRAADRILVLEDGEVMGIGTHDELLASCETYQEIYRSQMRSDETEASGKEVPAHA